MTAGSKTDSASRRSPLLFLFLEIFSREGGIQSYVKDIFQSYQSLPAQPTADVFLLRDGKTSENPFDRGNLKFHYFKSQSAAVGRVRLAIALLSYLLQKRPQCVVCGHVYLAPLVALFCRPLGIPYTVMTYGKEVWDTLAPAQQKALAEADTIWAISRYSRDCAAEKNNLPSEKFRMVPCVVSGDRFYPGPKSPQLLEKYGLADALVLMSVARLWSGDIYKGVDMTIRALPAIAKAFPDVKYLIVGRGDDQPRLAKLAEELRVADRAVFAGFVPTSELPDHYRLADAYVMPSQEGFGIVYLEAMCCGVPVLSGDADGSADPLQDGKLGWRVPHRYPGAIAAACIEMLTGIQTRRRYDRGESQEEGDRRCDGEWLRQETLAHFSEAALTATLQRLLP